MAHVHYKFSSKLKYDTMVFDGLHITLRDLKRQIMDREKLRAGDCDLQITNAQTKEEYKDDEDLISKNSSVIVRRIPMVGVKSSGGKTSKTIDRSDHSFHPHAFGVSKAMENQSGSRSLAFLSQTCNLAHADVSEADKIQAMMSQSNHEYDPMNYVKKHGIPPPNYTCFRCGLTGHHIRNCPTAGDKTFESLPKIKKSTGIPRSFMVEVDDPSIKGAMLTNCGRYAIPTIDAEAYAKGKKERPPFVPQQHQARVSGGNEEEREEGEAVPTELLCPICRETLHDAVLIPCCGNSYCDDCIRSALLESDEHVCPTCNKADVSPDTLVANKFLRQAVNSFKNEVGHKKSQTTKGSGTPVSQPPNPSPCPNPTPPASTQTRPQRPYPPIRHQQDPLLSHPPASHTPPLVQPSAMSPVATGASSAYSTPVGSPQRPQNHPDTPGSKEAEAEISIDAADPPIPSVSPSPEEEGPAAPPVMPPGYHVPVAEDLESSPKNAQMSPTYPIVGHSEQPPVQESSSTSSDLAGGGAWSYPMKDPCPSLPPSHPSSDSSPVLATPAASLLPLPLPPPPHQHFHPPPPLFPPKSFPPYPGFPPGYPFSAPPWAPPSLPAVFPNVPPPTLPSATSSIPPLIPKEEMYRHKTRMKERASSSHGANRDRQSQQRHKSNLDEMGSDFTKELLEYRRLQKQRRRSYSRSPQRSSSISQMSSDSYSKSYSHSSHSRSYSRSPSRSRSRSRSRGRSRSRSRSRSRPRHRQRSARRKANRAPDHGYKRSHSPTPPSSSPSRRRRSSRSRSWSRSRSRGSRQKTGGGHRHRARSCRCRHGPPGEQSSPERYRQWEREYMEWYDKYFGNYTGKPHHLQPPPLLPTPRHARGPPASGSARRPYSSSSYSSKCGESQPSRAATRRSHNPTPRQSPNRSPFPGSEDEAGSLTYQQRCSVMYGRQGSEWEKPEAPGLGTDHRKATLEHSDALPIAYRTSSTDLNDQNHKRKKRRRSERDRAEMGEAEEESLSLAASYASNRGHREGRSKRGSPRAPAVCSESDDPGDDACDNPRVGTQRGDGCPSAEPSRASEVGGPKDADRRLAHGSKDLDTSRSEKKKRREKEKNSKSPRTDEHRLDAQKSESSKSGRDGEDPRHGTKKRKPKTGEKEPGIRGSPTESCLWEGVTKVKKPQRKTISISINLRGQSDEARKGGESDRMAGSWVEVDKMNTGDEKEEVAAEKGVEENAAEDGAIKKQTPRATEEMTWGAEGMETKRIRRDDGGEVMEEEEKEEWMAGAKKRQSGEEPVEQMAEGSKAPGRRSKSNSAAGETAVHPSHRRDGREGRQERKVALKSLEKYSGPGGFLLPEDKKVLMQVPRSKWEQLGEEDEECGVEEEPASMEAQSASAAAAAVGAVSVAVPTTRAAAREGGTPEDGAREQRWWETEGERERGRTSETAKKKYREAASGGRAPASPVSKEPSEAPERHASPADAERAHKPGRAGRGTQRTGDGEGSKDQRAQRAMGTDRKREELEGRSKESERGSGGTAGAATDGQKRGPSSSRASSSSGSAGNKRARDPEYERGAARNSQSSSSRSSSSSSCSFSQPDVHPQRTPAGSVSGGRYREYGTPPRHDRSAYETHQEKPLAKPQDRQDDAESLKYHHHHHPQNRRPHNQDHRRHRDHDHPHIREHRDHHGDRPPAAPQPGGRPPALLASGGERREPRPLIPHSEQPGHGAGPPAAGRPTPGKAVAPADRGRSKPGSDVFSRGREPLLRPRKPIDIKIISGASLFQHVDLEKNNRL